MLFIFFVYPFAMTVHRQHWKYNCVVKIAFDMFHYVFIDLMRVCQFWILLKLLYIRWIWTFFFYLIWGYYGTLSPIMCYSTALYLLPQCFQFPNFFRVVLTIPKAKVSTACERIEEFCKKHYCPSKATNGSTGSDKLTNGSGSHWAHPNNASDRKLEMKHHSLPPHVYPFEEFFNMIN